MGLFLKGSGSSCPHEPSSRGPSLSRRRAWYPPSVNLTRKSWYQDTPINIRMHSNKLLVNWTILSMHDNSQPLVCWDTDIFVNSSIVIRWNAGVVAISLIPSPFVRKSVDHTSFKEAKRSRGSVRTWLLALKALYRHQKMDQATQLFCWLARLSFFLKRL